MPVLGIPLNWIVGPSGAVRSEQFGFGANDRWEYETLAAMGWASLPAHVDRHRPIL